MPLVRLFAQKTLQKAIPLKSLQAKLCGIWGVNKKTTKLIVTRVDDWTGEEFAEDARDRRPTTRPVRRSVLAGRGVAAPRGAAAATRLGGSCGVAATFGPPRYAAARASGRRGRSVPVAPA